MSNGQKKLSLQEPSPSPSLGISQLNTLNAPYIYLPETSTHGLVESSACCAWHCFFTGVLLDCLSLLVTGYCAWLGVKPLY